MRLMPGASLFACCVLLALLALHACGGSPSAPSSTPPPTPSSRRLLYVTTSAGFRHDVLPLSQQVLRDIGSRAGFDTVATEDVAMITRDNLAHFDAIAFFTSGELPMNDDQKAALLDFVRNGKGFVGIHSATDTFYTWPDYGLLIGAIFDGHPWHQEVTIRVEDQAHPATRSLPATWRLNDEIYQFRNWSRADVHVLLSLDTASVDLHADGVRRSDGDFALTWTRNEGRGRVFYTALGHEPGVWQDSRFQQLLAGGIGWAMGAQ
jgi:type 1 glutamine amidotransferase